MPTTAKHYSGMPFDELRLLPILRIARECKSVWLNIITINREAAKNVSSKFKDAHTEISWSAIIAQRNILAHEYGDILVERIWRVATVFVPELIGQLSRLVPPPPK